MPDILDPLVPVIDALEQLGITYFIGGSVASSSYGLPRSTIDIDIVAEIRMEHVGLLAVLLDYLGRWAAEIGVADLLKQALDEAGL